MKFIESARFMASSTSNFSDDLTEEIDKIKARLQFVLKYERTNENLTKYNCSSCNKTYWSKFKKKRFKNTFRFSNNDINKFILLLKKGVYPYEYMDA